MAEPRLILGNQHKMIFDTETGGYILFVRLDNLPDGTDFTIDGATGGLLTVDSPHYEVHTGQMYHAGFITGSVANNTSIDLLINTTGTSYYTHLVWEATCGGDAEVLLYEGVTGTYGSALTVHNMNRNFANASPVQVHNYPTITVLGINLVDSFLPGGTGGISMGGIIRANTEWILAPGKRYLLRLFNRAGTAKYAGLAVQFYTEPP